MPKIHADWILRAEALGTGIETMVSRGARTRSLAVQAGRVIATSHDPDGCANLSDNTTQVTDLPPGAWAFPAFTDAHLHPIEYGFQRLQIDLAAAQSVAEVQKLVRQQAERQPRDSWIVGLGWNEHRYADGPLTAQQLSQAAPDHYVYLRRVDLHAGWASESVLALAGITADRPDPPGGVIVRNSHRDPTGVLVDRAEEPVLACLPRRMPDRIAEALTAGVASCLAAGVTTVHDMLVTPELLAAWRRANQDPAFPLQVVLYLDAKNKDLRAEFGPDGPQREGALFLAGFKLFADGALGSAGAALVDDYLDMPGHRGLCETSREEIIETGAWCAERGFQLATHAIGDAANHWVLDAYAELLARYPAIGGRRWRIEHAQVLTAGDFARWANLPFVASVQPSHAVADFEWAIRRLGHMRASRAYAYGSLDRHGIRLAGGSDAPVEQVNPLAGMDAAIRRVSPGGPPAGWFPDERLSPQRAVELFTHDAAWAGFAEAESGQLTPGCRADVVVLSGNPILTRVDEISVMATYVAGTRVFGGW